MVDPPAISWRNITGFNEVASALAVYPFPALQRQNFGNQFLLVDAQRTNVERDVSLLLAEKDITLFLVGLCEAGPIGVTPPSPYSLVRQ